MLAVLIGSLPLEGPATLSKLGIPFILLADSIDHPAETIEGALRIEHVPFKSDPLAVLRVPLYEHITHVFSFTELGQIPAVLLAESLNVPSVPVSAVLRTRNKYFMRLALQKQVAQPLFGLLRDCDAYHIPYPVIVKPVDSSGSRGIAFIDHPTAFRERQLLGGSCLWEHYVDGREFSVEAVSSGGQHHILAITEKVTTGAPHYVEVAHCSPARLSPLQTAQIKETVVRCLDILEITRGASHTEVKYSDGQVFIIETHTRAGGDRIGLLTKLVTGYDQFELAVHSIIGNALPSPEKPVYPCAGVRYFRWKPGIIKAIEGIDVARKATDLVELDLTIKQDGRMPEWKDSSDRPGYAVMGGNTFEEVMAKLLTIEELIQVRYRE